MASIVRSSKFRHVFGEVPKQELCHTGIEANVSGSCEGNGLAASPSYFAYSLRNGKDVVVLPTADWKRHVSPPFIMSHSESLMDLQFSPFRDDILASCASDCLIRLWGIPQGGLKDKMGADEALVELQGHPRKVVLMDFHPTAQRVLSSIDQDGCVKVWDVEKGLEAFSRDPTPEFGGASTCLRWSPTGNSLATMRKQQGTGAVLVVSDPRASNDSGSRRQVCHENVRSSKCVWLDDNHICTVGFSRQSKREIRVWDVRNMNANGDAAAVIAQDIDQSSSLLWPFYDDATKMLYLAGKGSGSIKYYELDVPGGKIHFINDYRGTTQNKGIVMMPRRTCDTTKCEIARFCKLTNKSSMEPLTFRVPRKTGCFQKELYPIGCTTGEPASKASEYLSSPAGSDLPKVPTKGMDPGADSYVPAGPWAGGSAGCGGSTAKGGGFGNFTAKKRQTAAMPPSHGGAGSSDAVKKLTKELEKVTARLVKAETKIAQLETAFSELAGK